MLDVLGTYYTLPIMLALCLMLLGTYYAQNYAGIIGRSLGTGRLCQHNFEHIIIGSYLKASSSVYQFG